MDPSSLSYLQSSEGVHFDGRSYALHDPNFKINHTLTIHFQLKTSAKDGLILWLEDPLIESSLTVEIQNHQLITRVVSQGQPFSVRTDFNRNRLCDGVWHYIQIRVDGHVLTMKVDKRQYAKSEGRVQSVEMRGPLFIGGYSEKYRPSYLSVRTRDFFHGSLRHLKINDESIEWLAPRTNITKPDFYG